MANQIQDAIERACKSVPMTDKLKRAVFQQEAANKRTLLFLAWIAENLPALWQDHERLEWLMKAQNLTREGVNERMANDA